MVILWRRAGVKRRRFYSNPNPTQKASPIFIPFLTAAAVATTFGQLGAMSVKIVVLTALLQAMSIAFLAVALSAIALFMRTRRGALN